MHRLMGLVHAQALGAAELAGDLVTRAGSGVRRGERGQGTVEYVALILLVALVMAGVVAGMQSFQTDQGKDLADVLLGKIKDAIRKVAF